jgi:tetratricopeptide (TPR) repeat protein
MNAIDGSPYETRNGARNHWLAARTPASLHAESVAALHAGSPDIALQLIEAALRDDRADPLHHCHHAVCLTVIGRFPEAEQIYWDVLRKHPQITEATQGLRALYNAVGSQGHAVPQPPRRDGSPRNQSARHRHREAAELKRRRM